MTKRLFDLVVATTALVIVAPLLLLIAAAVRIDSPGPAIFRQRRIGLHGRPFEILKFRSMIYRSSVNGPKITAAGDRRITRLGRYLRAAKLDELPQLWNVIRGDMSLVGPRPEVPEYVAYYSSSDRDAVLSVRPGMTDRAAIEFRDESAMLAGAADPHALYVDEILPRKLAIYRRYAACHSVSGDIRILWTTVCHLIGRCAGSDAMAERKTASIRSTPTAKDNSRT